ncbi:hypothetical protein [Altererythrobacter sp. ZODW24]|uniref:hypothetical protein n=1 Tax=Altererythrobacter sp. ZODW24 TaxID=2185142 RepID=UPI0013B3735A|nr:hypothetical protein [Altererythrobacter sp. ZODW24]
MSARGERRRGQPLLVLGLVLVGWAAMRSALWQSPFPVPTALAEEIVERFAVSEGTLPPLAQTVDRADRAQAPRAMLSMRTSWGSPLPPIQLDQASPLGGWSNRIAPAGRRTASSHQILWMAGASALPIAPEIAAAYQEWRAPRIPFRPKAGRAGWSADGWVLYRPGSRSGFAATQGPASYGASQAGAALRYRISPGSAHRPQAYFRATTALSQSEREAALGLSARPFGGLPIRVAGEVRYSKLQAGNELRPAAFAHTELPPVDLTAGLRAEVYAQAGYIGGDYATAFVDGQASVMLEAARFDLGTLRAGGGTWGGAQKGAGRLDVGPTAALDIEVSDVRARVSVDYRIKVAGDAEPGSGAALTLATGF